jgi:hypothetical protein
MMPRSSEGNQSDLVIFWGSQSHGILGTEADKSKTMKEVSDIKCRDNNPSDAFNYNFDVGVDVV